MDFSFSEEIELLRRSVRDYVNGRLRPLEDQIEREDRIPDEVVREMAELGFFGFPFPEHYGGVGSGEVGYCVALEELGATSSAITNLIGAHTGICAMSIYLAGSEEQKQQWLVPLAKGEKIGSFGLTEPEAGSDAASIRTTAKLDGDFWVLNGQKQWITNAPIAGTFVIYAANDRERGARGGITAFVVPRDLPGLTVGVPDEKMGLRGSFTAPVYLDTCRVPVTNVLGQVGGGFVTAMTALDGGRVSLAAGAVGMAKHMLALSIQHAKARKQFGVPIASFQAIQWMLADMETEIQVARALVYQAAAAIDRGERVSHEAAIVKLFSSEMANRAVDKAVQIHGGQAYMKGSPVERAYRDARILRIYEGTSEVQRLLIAEHLLR
ncbi:MAG: acyl-CoA dehydrogenase family protein [Dehalococcoidia bacterium]